MKKLIYLSILLLLIAVLPSFTTAVKHVSYPEFSTDKSGTCAAPTNLNATKSGTSVTLSWTSGPLVHTYGGYYNYTDQYGNPASSNFGGSTNVYPISITVPSSTYSITFSVTAICNDGTNSTSSVKTVHF